jgi:hypothetical protein
MTDGLIPENDFMAAVSMFGILCSALGLMQMALDYVFVTCFTYTAEKQVSILLTIIINSYQKDILSECTV